MRLFLVDTLTAVVFFTCVAALSELFVAGMPPSAVLFTRLVMVPVIVCTGRPYGWWRDVVFARVRPHSALASTLTDIAAFLAFQVPVYGLTLLAAGASLAQITAALGAAAVLMVLLSRPYGLLLNAARRLAGARPGAAAP
ncbi:L-alanine exporter AlaE [Oceanicola sp. 502str15]|uniref:L-alanine exporter AlaE n=1 Tax=Oceanicola sp. 502str15 TaxID=2696061 RepID=UPI002095C9C0|nr:L-alanine exporter AlaE [Oceanicola sp. 502str15]MCO6383725.1 L-alanine exporter AlaE [Oceanicola sp. 502str15]